jgi:hypothetical protein
MSIDLDDPIALMLVAAAALERSGAECAAYGGLALGMYGEPRETRDADFAVTGVDVERARLALADLGVEVVIAFSNVRFGGCDVSRLSLVGGSQVNTVDLVAPRSPRFAGNLFRRAAGGPLPGHEIRAQPRPEDTGSRVDAADVCSSRRTAVRVDIFSRLMAFRGILGWERGPHPARPQDS